MNGIPPGVWQVFAGGDQLHLVSAGDFREAMVEIMCGMPAARTAAFTLVFSANMDEWQVRLPYERALRELYVEVGAEAQHLIIAAEALRLGCLITPATNDYVLSELLGLRDPSYPVHPHSWSQGAGVTRSCYVRFMPLTCGRSSCSDDRLWRLIEGALQDGSEIAPRRCHVNF